MYGIDDLFTGALMHFAARRLVQTGQSLRGGMVFRAFRVRCGQRIMALTTFTLPDGTLEQYQIASP